MADMYQHQPTTTTIIDRFSLSLSVCLVSVPNRWSSLLLSSPTSSVGLAGGVGGTLLVTFRVPVVVADKHCPAPRSGRRRRRIFASGSTTRPGPAEGEEAPGGPRGRVASASQCLFITGRGRCRQSLPLVLLVDTRRRWRLNVLIRVGRCSGIIRDCSCEIINKKPRKK